MKAFFLVLAILTFCLAPGGDVLAQAGASNFVYFTNRGLDGSSLRSSKALADSRFDGAQVAYTWKSLEPKPGLYDFSAIKADLAFLRSIDKKLWVQLQEKSFRPDVINVPGYILLDPKFDGGVLKQSMLSAPERDPKKAASADEYGWAAKMWQPEVRNRFQALIKALGVEFDGEIEGLNLSESSIEVGAEQPDGTTVFPEYFDPEVYVAAVASNMVVMRASFRKSAPMVYLNFLPGEWLPWQDHGYMRGLFELAERLGMGVGGPDLMPYRKSHMSQTYQFFKRYPDALVKGMAVQDGNLRQINPMTSEKNTADDIIAFAEGYLGLDYIFWVQEEPYFTKEVLPALESKRLPARLGTE